MCCFGLQGAQDYAPDVAMAKKQASQQLKHVENTHAEFLKKLHKVISSTCMHPRTQTQNALNAMYNVGIHELLV